MSHFLAIDNFSDIKTLVTVCYVIFVASAIAVVIYDRRDPVKALAWILVISFVPILGIVIYIVFGRNHRKEKLFNRKELRDLEQIDCLCRDQLKELLNPDRMLAGDVSDNRDIITLLLNNNRALLTMKNRVRILNNGKETFAALFESLRNATSSIHLEYYIFEADRIGRRIGRILMEKAKAGVSVRLIYDDVGSWNLKYSYVKKLRAAGVEVGCFMPVAFPWLTSKVNYRNHRKIAVIDGKVAYTGGINIAERYLTGTRMGPWRDTHLKIEGEATHMLQTIFITDWYFVSGKLLPADETYFPKPKITQITPLQIASSGPDSDWASIMQAFFAAMTRAQKYIYISTPYFLPNQAILTALKVAALSGIDVRIMIPSRSDSKIVYWASRSYISELIEAGIRVYFYRKGFNHSKLMIIDGKFCSVGSANMDIRSFEDNFEVSAVIYDRKTSRQLEAVFMRDLDNCTEITPQEWEKRSNLHATYESLSRLLSPLL